MTKMTDKELLELAAKAAGYSTSTYWHNDEIHCGKEYEYTDGPDGWNPLTNEGDCYRLARKLGITIDFEKCFASAFLSDSEEISLSWEFDSKGGDTRAIVRIAAEIGKMM